MSLSTKIIIGLAAGIALGLFLGELAAPFDHVGKAFVLLLQMAVLPYVFVSLIAGLGKLDASQAKTLAAKGGLLLVITWVVAFAIILLMPLSFPDRVAAAFFSTSIVTEAEPPDLLALYIPANPFRSLSENLVPAVVVFSIAMGVALINIKNKQMLTEPLSVVSAALTSVTSFVVKLTPYGVFAIAAAAAGTMSVDEFQRLQVYLIAFSVACLLATLWVLPGLVSALTPIKYWDVVKLSRDALVTAFTTGNLFVILPILSQNARELFEKYDLKSEQSDALIDIIIPVSFNFPNVGKLMMIIFVLFAAWFSGVEIGLTEYPGFVISALVTFFGSVNVAIPFLLDSLKIPSDLFQLFLVATVVNMRMATLVAAMHVMFLAIVGTCAITGMWEVKIHRLLRFLGISAVITIGIIVVCRVYFTAAIDTEYKGRDIVLSMDLDDRLQPSKAFKALPKPLPLPEEGVSRLDAAVERRLLRVGYFPDLLPFAYFNSDDQLVGFDVAMAHHLANELDLKLEFVPTSANEMTEHLREGYIDVVMSGLIGNTERFKDMTLSAPYLDMNLGLVVRDHRRRDFATLEQVRAMEALTIAVPSEASKSFKRGVSQSLPNAEIVEVDSLTDFFEAGAVEIDALILQAETGSALSLVYPRFAVVVPKPVHVEMPAVYAVPPGDERMANFLSQWIALKKGDQTIDSLYSRWVLGENAIPAKPRWSVIRNVLGWVD